MSEATFKTKIPVWDQIKSLTEDIPGWAPLDQMFALYNLAIASSHVPGEIVEIGTWCGKTSVVLGKAAAATDSHLHCIDLFPERSDWHQNEDGSYSMRVTIDGITEDGYNDQTVWQEPFERDIEPVYEKFGSIYATFKNNIQSTGVATHVTAYQDTSSVIEKQDLGPFRMAFLDGDHGYDAVRKDIQIVTERLSAGGWICFDDAFSSYEGVNAAIEDGILANPIYGRAYQVTRKCFVAQKTSS